MATTYLITNLVNGKLYIGFTKQTMRTRWTQHCCESGSSRTTSALHTAIRKYGRDAFTIRALGRGSIADMLELERAKIAELGTMAPAGYNLTEGGEYAQYSDASRAKMSASAKARAAQEDRSEQLLSATRTRWAKPGARERAATKRKGIKRPDHGAKMRALWADPEYRARNLAARKRK